MNAAQFATGAAVVIVAMNLAISVVPAKAKEARESTGGAGVRLLERYGRPLPKDPPIRFRKLMSLGTGGSAEFAPDGLTLAVPQLFAVNIWSLEKRAIVRIIPSGARQSNDLMALVPPGDRLLTSRFSINTVSLWDVRTGNLLDTLDTGGKPDSRITGLAAFPDGKRAICCADTGLFVWDLETKNHKKLPLDEYVPLRFGERRPAARRCHSVSITADGSRFATSVNDALLSMGILLWDAKTWRVTRVIPTGIGEGHVAYAPDGSTVAADYHDPNFHPDYRRKDVVGVWDAATGKKLVVGSALQGPTRCLAYTRDGKYLFIVGQREGPPFPFGDEPGGPPVVGVWEVATGKLVNDVPIPVGQWFPRIAISPDNKLLAVPAGGKIDIYAIEYAEQAKGKGR